MDFERVYEAYFQPVYRYLMTLCKNEHIAQELTSETFFKAMQAIGRFRGECDVYVWLCQIAKNCYFTYLKKYPKMAELPDLSGPDTVADRLEDQSDAMQVHLLLHALKEPYREVFTLRVFGELSFKQIAAIFGKTENWACVTYYRARRKLLEQMEEQNGT